MVGSKGTKERALMAKTEPRSGLDTATDRSTIVTAVAVVGLEWDSLKIWDLRPGSVQEFSRSSVKGKKGEDLCAIETQRTKLYLSCAGQRHAEELKISSDDATRTRVAKRKV